MSTTYKPGSVIPTKYAGKEFRSRTEARWAVFFDCLGVTWEYEPEGFQFSDGTRYLPDFLLTGIVQAGSPVFWEVKPDMPGGSVIPSEWLAKIDNLALTMPDSVVVLALGAPTSVHFDGEPKPRLGNWLGSTRVHEEYGVLARGTKTFGTVDGAPMLLNTDSKSGHPLPNPPAHIDYWSPVIVRAAQKARAYEFWRRAS